MAYGPLGDMTIEPLCRGQGLMAVETLVWHFGSMCEEASVRLTYISFIETTTLTSTLTWQVELWPLTHGYHRYEASSLSIYSVAGAVR